MSGAGRPFGERVLLWGIAIVVPLVIVIGLYLVLHARDARVDPSTRDPNHLVANPATDPMPTVDLTKPAAPPR
jgi:hypothetical protein